MSVPWKPADMPTISVALPGGRGLVDFMARVFDTRPARTYEMADGRIAHAEIRLGDSLVMTADHMPEHPIGPGQVSVYVPDCDASYANALAAGATSKQAPKDEFYGDRTARVVDAFGTQWGLATHTEDVSEAEIERRMKAWKPDQS